jgi:HAT1-interacting factor 1
VPDVSSSSPPVRSSVPCSAEKFGDVHPSSAPLLLMYGKTLLELAIAQNQVMQQDAGGAGEGAEDDGGDDDQEQTEEDKAQRKYRHVHRPPCPYQLTNVHDMTLAVAKNIISELTTISQDDEPQAGASGSTSKIPSPPSAVPEGEQPDEGDVMEDPEDDFNAAWEVLDTARRLFGEMPGGKARLQEADCLLTLGDISLETGQYQPIHRSSSIRNQS